MNKIEKLDYTMLSMLDELYIDSRYPGDMGLLPHGKPSLEDAQEFYDFSLDVLKKVCLILKTTIDDIHEQ
jgi:HEPN domain-containing protein